MICSPTGRPKRSKPHGTATAGQLVAEFVELGYIRLVTDPQDRRAKIARYTAKGKRLLRAIERSHASLDLSVVPQRTVLFRQENGFSVWSATRRGTRRLQLHQRQQTINLSLLRKKLCQPAAKADCFHAQCCPHPLLPRGCGVSFVEDQVDDREYRLKPAYRQ